MNGDGEDLVAQERRIWCPCPEDQLYIHVVNAEDDYCTISEIRDFIEQHVENGTNNTIVSRLRLDHYANSPPITKQECTLLGRSFRPLAHHLQEFGIVGRGWTDLETSCILRHMSLQSSKINVLTMNGSYGEMSLSIRMLCDDSPATLQTLRVSFVVLTSVDCQILGQMISNKERAIDCLLLYSCSFPCLLDFMILIAGFIKDKIPSDCCEFCGCTVKDTSIPTHDGEDYLEFVRIFGEFWQRRDGEPETNTHEQEATPLEKSALDLLNYFRPMQKAGLPRLLPPSENTDRDASVTKKCQPRERREWVEVLGHEAVIDRVDLLFHVLLLNPEVCVLERECSEPQNHSGQRRRKKVRRNY